MGKNCLYLLLLFQMLILVVGCGSKKPVGPQYEAVEGTGEPVSVRWDFGQEAGYEYRFEQVVNSKAASFAGGGQIEKVVIKGDCLIKSEGDKEAVFQVGNLVLDKQQSSKDVEGLAQQYLANVSIEGLLEDGTFKNEDAAHDPVFRSFLKLPDAPIAQGATEVVDVSMPFELDKGAGKLLGKQATTFVGYYEIYGVNCVHLEMEYEFYEFEDAEGKKSDQDLILIKGNSTVYYDEKDKRVHRSVSECEVKLDMGLASIDRVVKITLHRI